VLRAVVALPGGPAKPATDPVSSERAKLAKPSPTPKPNGAALSALSASSESRSIVDACGMTAVQAVRRLSEVATQGGVTQVRLVADAAGIDAKVLSWATATDAEVESVRREGAKVLFDLKLAPEQDPMPRARGAHAPGANTVTEVVVLKPGADTRELATVPDDGVAVRENRATFLVLKNDLEGLLAAMMCANAAAAQGMKVDVFFSFWAVHLLRGEKPRAGAAAEPVGFVEGLMKWFVPSGPRRQQLAKLRMGGVGTRMLNWLMRKRKILTLEQLVEQAVKQEVRFVVCSMSMGLMGLTKRDIVDLPNVEFAGVASFVEHGRRASMSMVF
jgi:peroxiredoxin family protein